MYKNPYFKQKIDVEKYVNVETGESIGSEFEITSINTTRKEVVILSSQEYLVIDSKALNYIYREFNSTEVGRILQMADMVKGCYNLLYDKKNNAPHTKDTLNEEMDYTTSRFNLFMKKLHEKSIIYYLVGFKNRRKCKWIMLNPTLARKQKTFSRDCIDVFTDLTKR